jgi:hypothetical protein
MSTLPIAFSAFILLGPSAPSAEPNLLLDIRRELAEAAAGQDVARPENISDVIRRTHITGTGYTTGKVGLQFVPNGEAAVMDLVLTGSTNSRTVGVNGPVFIHSTNLTTFTARKRLVIDAEGTRESAACATAQQQTQLDCLTTRFGCVLDPIVRRAALRTYEREKHIDLQIAAEHAARNVAYGFDRDSGPQVADANKSYRDLRDRLGRKNVFPEEMALSTTSDVLSVRGRLGDTPAPPAPPAVAAELSLRVHESLLNTGSARLFAGKTYTPEQFQEELSSLLGPLAPKSEPDPKKAKKEEVLEITFAKNGPIETLFRNGTIAVTVRGEKFRADEDEYAAMNITAVYKLLQTPKGIEAVREGDLTIVPPGYEPGKTKLSSSQIALRRILQRRFGRDVFKPKLELQEITPTGDMAKLGTLRTSQASAQGGWLAAGLERAGKK